MPPTPRIVLLMGLFRLHVHPLKGALYKIWYDIQVLLWQQQRREPSLDELAEVMQREKEQVLLLLQLQHEMVSLEHPVYSEDEVTLVGDQIAAPDDSEQREQQQEAFGRNEATSSGVKRNRALHFHNTEQE